ncbi:hypothetical protein KKP62_28920 [Rhodococcus sp. GOMB7]|uniref:hypothetical protein n=1 Tax=unclassified Rhodococcus (in: high G+C Gram-positive bacteria) TaxID=192944 RepID=UPI0015F43353|nr:MULTISPECIES: hypothetical protein [unclassified Rhodococcus (in: high G+C Gram-positive bacteria)]MBT9298998.1 hypothetical protein [Rhodococcus sp. GOMB7]
MLRALASSARWIFSGGTARLVAAAFIFIVLFSIVRPYLGPSTSSLIGLLLLIAAVATVLRIIVPTRSRRR